MPLVRVRVVGRDDALVAPPDVPVRPVEVELGEPLVDRARGRAARERDAERAGAPRRARRSSRRRARLGRDPREAPYRLLVDPVAPEEVELVREQVARRPWRSTAAGLDRLAVHLDRARSRRRARARARRRGRVVRRASRRGGAPPASGAATRSVLDARRSRARGRRARRRHGSSRAQAMSETAIAVEELGQRARSPRSGSSHSVESTISRSATPTSSSSSVEPKGSVAAPAQEGREVGDEQRRRRRLAGRVRRASRAGAARSPRSRPHPAPPAAKQRRSTLGVERVPLVVRAAGRAGSCATGWRSPSPPSVRVACLDPALGHPGHVRHDARPQAGRAASSAVASLAQARELALDVPDGRVVDQCRLQERPSRCSSSSAAAGPHVPAA